MEPRPPNVLLAYDGSEPARRALDRVMTFMPNASVAVVPVAAPVYPPVGDAAEEIVRIAGEAGADLVVLGARGLNPLKRLLLGSVSTRVLHEALCDVLVVK